MDLLPFRLPPLSTFLHGLSDFLKKCLDAFRRPVLERNVFSDHGFEEHDGSEEVGPVAESNHLGDDARHRRRERNHEENADLFLRQGIGRVDLKESRRLARE